MQLLNIPPDTWLNLLAGLIGAGMTAVGFVITRRKTKADAVSVELANLEKAISIYRTITEDLQNDIKQLEVKLEKLYVQNTQLIQENRTLKKKMQELEHKLSANK